MSQENEKSSFRIAGLRSVPVNAVVLIALGVLLLLQTTGIVSWGVWFSLWSFWPVLIIAFGVSLVFRRSIPWLGTLIVAGLIAGPIVFTAFTYVEPPPGAAVTLIEEPLDGLETVNVHVGFGAGELRLNTLPEGSTMLVQGRLDQRGGTTELTRSGNTADLDIMMTSDWFLSDLSPDTRWDIGFSGSPKLNLDVDAGASKMELDLRDLKVRELSVDAGASSIEITMPASAGRVDANISGGVASLDVVIPAGVAARIEIDSGLSSIDVDSRFQEVNGEYMSDDYHTADNRIDLRIEMGLSSITIR